MRVSSSSGGRLARMGCIRRPSYAFNMPRARMGCTKCQCSTGTLLRRPLDMPDAPASLSTCVVHAWDAPDAPATLSTCVVHAWDAPDVTVARARFYISVGPVGPQSWHVRATPEHPVLGGVSPYKHDACSAQPHARTATKPAPYGYNRKAQYHTRSGRGYIH
jgi:hypothetical protein